MPVPPPRKPPLKKGPKATVADEATMAARARGALLGLCLGEALGGPHEFKNLVSSPFPTLNEGPFDNLMRGGRCELLKGQTGQATQQAVCLSNVLREHLAYDVFAAGKAYLAWQEHAFDISEATLASFLQLHDGRSPEVSGKRAWYDSAQLLKDNASLARTVPIGLFFARDRMARLQASLADCAITHFAPVCQIACVTLNAIVAAAVLSPAEKLEKPEILKVIEADLSLAASTLALQYPELIGHVTDAANDLREDVRMAQEADPELYGPDLHLFQKPTRVRLAFRLSLWELFHAPTLEAALIDVVNRGGDTDTNAAITGVLLGAVHGEAGVRPEWKETILEGPIGLHGALNSTYHPRMLMPFAGQFAKAPAVEKPAPPPKK